MQGIVGYDVGMMRLAYQRLKWDSSAIQRILHGRGKNNRRIWTQGQPSPNPPPHRPHKKKPKHTRGTTRARTTNDDKNSKIDTQHPHTRDTALIECGNYTAERPVSPVLLATSVWSLANVILSSNTNRFKHLNTLNMPVFCPPQTLQTL